MKFVLDTSAYSRLDKPDPQLRKYIESAEVIAVPTIVVGELYFGFCKGSREQLNIDRLHRFLRTPRVVLVPVDGHIAERYGRLKALQYATGKPLADNDLWIAASCLQLGFPLLTADGDFERIADDDFSLMELGI